MDMIRLITERVMKLHLGDNLNEATNYKDMDDEELVVLVKRNDKRAQDELYKRYYKLAPHLARQKGLYLPSGGDQEDLTQAAMVGLFSAAKDYKPGMNKNFKQFAIVAMTRNMIDATRSANAKKHSAANNAYDDIARIENRGKQNTELRKRSDDNQAGTYQLSHSLTPEKALIDKENKQRLLKYMKKNLTSWEQEVLKLYLQGMDYDTIADKLGKDNKAINNAMNKVRSKLRGYQNMYRECKIVKKILECVEFGLKSSLREAYNMLYA